jgi:hypothetical protein
MADLEETEQGPVLDDALDRALEDGGALPIQLRSLSTYQSDPDEDEYFQQHTMDDDAQASLPSSNNTEHDQMTHDAAPTLSETAPELSPEQDQNIPGDEEFSSSLFFEDRQGTLGEEKEKTKQARSSGVMSNDFPSLDTDRTIRVVQPANRCKPVRGSRASGSTHKHEQHSQPSQHRQARQDTRERKLSRRQAAQARQRQAAVEEEAYIHEMADLLLAARSSSSDSNDKTDNDDEHNSKESNTDDESLSQNTFALRNQMTDDEEFDEDLVWPYDEEEDEEDEQSEYDEGLYLLYIIIYTYTAHNPLLLLIDR